MGLECLCWVEDSMPNQPDQKLCSTMKIISKNVDEDDDEEDDKDEGKGKALGDANGPLESFKFSFLAINFFFLSSSSLLFLVIFLFSFLRADKLTGTLKMTLLFVVIMVLMMMMMIQEEEMER